LLESWHQLAQRKKACYVYDWGRRGIALLDSYKIIEYVRLRKVFEMITNIKVNGFRSLNGFSLQLKPGLNILVGPNGSGKTNIIAFFEFLSNMVENGVTNAVNAMGGVGSVFGKFGGDNDESCHKIDSEITGSCESQKNNYINYRYKFSIEASPDFSKIFFSEQIIDINFSEQFNQEYYAEEKSFHLKQSLLGEERKYTVKNLDSSLDDLSFLKFMGEGLEDFLHSFLGEELSIVIILKYIFNNNKIATDLHSGQAFNFIPSKIKMPEAASSAIGIKRDGSGLAATLYAIDAIKNKKAYQQNIENNLDNVSISDIIKYVKTANNSIDKIIVYIDSFENLLKIKFSIIKDNEEIYLPITSMSDGTIKWVSFVTSILTSPTVFSIEEPENYLHPAMQRAAIALMRDTIDNKGKKSSILMSTHSETILNSASPNEIIITEFKNASTIAKRCSNIEDIKSEIAQTGFGLGYYYITGSIEYE
jgi:predicted ATPase